MIVSTLHEVIRDLLPAFRLATILGNPGTAEVSFRVIYALGLQESAVVAMVEGYAQVGTITAATEDCPHGRNKYDHYSVGSHFPVPRTRRFSQGRTSNGALSSVKDLVASLDAGRRPAIASALSPYDLVLVLGAPALTHHVYRGRSVQSSPKPLALRILTEVDGVKVPGDR